jgi:hypothetical protein
LSPPSQGCALGYRGTALQAFKTGERIAALAINSSAPPRLYERSLKKFLAEAQKRREKKKSDGRS